MHIFTYILEFIGVFIVIFGLNYIFKLLFSKKFNEITTAIFTFLATLFIAFIMAPYILSFPTPALFYLPVAIGLAIRDVYHAMKSG